MTNRLYSHENLSSKLTNIRCVIQGTNQTGSKNNFPFPTDHRTFCHTKVPWGPPKGAWLTCCGLGECLSLIGCRVSLKICKKFTAPRSLLDIFSMWVIISHNICYSTYSLKMRPTVRIAYNVFVKIFRLVWEEWHSWIICLVVEQTVRQRRFQVLVKPSGFTRETEI